MNVVVTIVIYICILALLFGFLCSITGEIDKGSIIVNYCFTALILIAVTIIFFFHAPNEGSIFTHSIPLISRIGEYGSLTDYFTNSPGEFAVSFVELVTLILVINWVSGVLSLNGGGLIGKIISKLIIFFVACIGYGFLMTYLEDNPVLKWFIYIVECIITGSAILYTPALILSAYLNIKEGTFLSTYILSILPKTNLGKAISSSITTAVTFLLVIVALEKQYGSIVNTLNDALVVVESFGVIIIMIFGLYFIIKSITR